MSSNSGGIVSQPNDKVFTLKMAGKRLFWPSFAFHESARNYDGAFYHLVGFDVYVVSQHGPGDASASSDLHVVTEKRVNHARRGGGYRICASEVGLTALSQ